MYCHAPPPLFRGIRRTAASAGQGKLQSSSWARAATSQEVLRVSSKKGPPSIMRTSSGKAAGARTPTAARREGGGVRPGDPLRTRKDVPALSPAWTRTNKSD